MIGQGPGPAEDRPVEIRDLTGAALAAALDDLAGLRSRVFRAFPYLYDGDPDYERAYLSAYGRSPRALVVGAFHDGALIGAATAAPMADHEPAFAEPFRARGMDIADLYYFGESVLLPEWRGRGIGHAFFDRREARARDLGFSAACFCAVIRPDDHPARPAGYSPLDPFWRKRGFAPVEGMVADYDWRDIGQATETRHGMQFWMKRLNGAEPVTAG